MDTNQFFKGVFSDADGPSFSRCSSGMLLVFALVWITYLVFHGHAMPDLNQVGTWVITMTGMLYGTNRLTTAMGKFARPGGTDQPDAH